MKKYFLLVFVAIITVVFPSFGQVGINTENPLAALDVNGNLRIRKVTTNTTTQNILVLGADSIVYTNTVSNLFPTSNQKSFVRGTGAQSISLVNISLLTGWFKINMPTEAFDENNDYNTTTSEFTAPVTGIYNVYVQFKTTSVVSAAEVGVGIFLKPSGSSTYSLIAEETFLSVNVNVAGLLNLDVSPPTRKTQTLLKLNAGDVIIFGAKVPLVSLTLVGGTSTYFTINQVK